MSLLEIYLERKLHLGVKMEDGERPPIAARFSRKRLAFGWVPEDILVERVVGRRLDPITGKIYHLKYSPPETQEIASRLTQCFDDTEEKVKLRLNTHHQNVEAVLSLYEGITTKVKLRLNTHHQNVEAVLSLYEDITTKVKLLLNTHHQNVEAVLSLYEDITTKINGSVTKEDVFAEIDSALTRLVEKRKATWESLAA
nr:adenylate kinase 2, chloroplastic-like [Malus domestica]